MSSIKLYIGSEIRRLNLSETKSYKDLVTKVSLFVKGNVLSYKYQDTDADWVTFSTEEEWQEALKNFHKDGFKIKVIVEGEVEKKPEQKPQERQERHCPRFQQQQGQGHGRCPRF